ncbi:site-specific integrase [Enterobacter cloacae subsp. cloacae]|uniref:tyrosine-type recombinase/integrase n=1 Tax=Enterobacter cloacae TaxID=550 RepID=UPI0025B0FEBE|nr:site-specific integrase [Enterobacter cloacae]WLD34133.1 site-specific integrase [Enterobacter cloacae subsp. cloacae]
MSKYPTGVENHGGSLRLWFMYQGERVRESLGVPDTPKNRKIAGELRTSICYAIRTGTFDYNAQFPNSPRAKVKDDRKLKTSVSELAYKWLALKQTVLAKNTHMRYTSYVKMCLRILDDEMPISSLTHEDLMSLRHELLTGYQLIGKTLERSHKKGRTVRTVNGYMAVMLEMLKFAERNGYTNGSVISDIRPLRKSKSEPDPLTKEEFVRLLEATNHQQTRNLWVLAVSTGMRHGEICALAWEDVDTVNWTVKVNRNLAISDHFSPPKTESGIRTINLTQSAIEALKSQMQFTRMKEQHEIVVHLREYGKQRTDLCTFVFNPNVSARYPSKSICYIPGSIASSWNHLLKRAGIRHRKAYESRHTFACWALSAGANPSFIANQMGHTNAQMVFNVYGKWMSEQNGDQVALLNTNFDFNAPQMPHNKAAGI